MAKAAKAAVEIEEDDYEKKLVQAFLKIDKVAKRDALIAEESKKQRDEAEAVLIEFLDTTGKKKSASYVGIGHVTFMKPKAKTSWVIDEEALFTHLRSEEIDRDDLIKTQVHPSSLTAYINQYLEEHNLEPPGVEYVMRPSLRAYPEK